MNTSKEAVCKRFLSDGYIIVPVENSNTLDNITALVGNAIRSRFDPAPTGASQSLLDLFHNLIDPSHLNSFRLDLIHSLHKEDWFLNAYHELAKNAVEMLVGTELAMQRRVNLSIQLPGDSSSLLPPHADVWAGDSPYEIVQWVPLVNTRNTKSMFILPMEKSCVLHSELHTFSGKSSDELFDAIKDDVIFPEVKYGEVMLFTQTAIHGNRVNEEGETRWSFNCRFKSLFSPYADKKLGEFFKPVSIKTATKIGLEFAAPDGFAK